MLLDLRSPTEAGPPPSDLPRRLFTAGVLAAWFAVAALPVFATQGVQNEKLPPKTTTVFTQQLIQRQWIPEPSRAMRAWAVPSAAQEVSQPVPYTSAQSFIQAQWPSPETRALPPRYVPINLFVGDAPPPKTYVFETITRSQWTPPVLTPIYQTVGLQDVLSDNPPPKTYVFETITRNQWTPPIVTPILTAQGVQDGPDVVIPDNPPPKTYVYETITRSQWLTGWEIPIKRHITIQNGAVNPFDAPPLRTYGNERILLRQWVPLVVTPTYQTVGFQDAIADTGADNPPPSTRNWLQIIQRQWIPRVPVAEWYFIQIDTSFKIAVDRLDQEVVIRQWETPIWPKARRTVLIPSGAPDPVGDFAPRKSYVNERMALSQWDTSWVIPKKPNTTIQNGAPDPVITPDNPPPRSQYWVPLIQQQWIPREPVAEWYSIQIDLTTPPPAPRWRHDIVLRQWEDQAQEIWPKARRPQVIESGPDVPDVTNLVWYYIPQIRKGGRLL